ncbi:MAG: hypothetical protein H7Z42_19095 [Roseiflexaceae bacterium]|nr:hypothetical protein [Roseiflexaceae bacterium]
MTTLSTSEAGELCLTLRGEAENRILATLRRWPHWQRVVIERHPDDAGRCVAVTLIADSSFESTMREILKRSFNLTFPVAGGSSELAAEVPTPVRASRYRR